jgi:hypothetical protein
MFVLMSVYLVCGSYAAHGADSVNLFDNGDMEADVDDDQHVAINQSPVYLIGDSLDAVMHAADRLGQATIEAAR